MVQAQIPQAPVTASSVMSSDSNGIDCEFLSGIFSFLSSFVSFGGSCGFRASWHELHTHLGALQLGCGSSVLQDCFTATFLHSHQAGRGQESLVRVSQGEGMSGSRTHWLCRSERWKENAGLANGPDVLGFSLGAYHCLRK